MFWHLSRGPKPIEPNSRCGLSGLVTLLAPALAPGAAAMAAICTSNAGALNWNTAATWNCGHVPATADSVIVPNASTVTLDVDTNTLASLQVNAGGRGNRRLRRLPWGAT
jgi:hypothetical protein